MSAPSRDGAPTLAVKSGTVAGQLRVTVSPGMARLRRGVVGLRVVEFVQMRLDVVRLVVHDAAAHLVGRVAAAVHASALELAVGHYGVGWFSGVLKENPMTTVLICFP